MTPKPARQMRGALQGGLTAALAIVLVVLVINGLVSYNDTRTIVGYQTRLAHTDGILRSLQQVLLATDDAETGERGYLLTGNPNFLTPYTEGARVIAARLQQLESLTGNDPTASNQVRHLHLLTLLKFTELSQTIAVRRQQGIKAAIAIVSTGRDKHSMDSIRGVIAQLQFTEENELRSRTRASTASNRRAMATIAIATVANVALLLFLFALVLRALRRRERMSRDKDDFLSAAAHDLRTPLTTIQGVTQLLQRRARKPESLDPISLQHDLGRIIRNTNRMTGLIDELLDATRMQMGKPLELRLSAVDLVALTRTVATEAGHLSARHRIEINSEQDAIVGIWDGGRLERVLTNLLSNAIKYSPNGGVVHLRLDCDSRDDGDWAICTIADGGIGIPPGDLPRIFNRFHRASNASGKIPGTGVGLSSARQIVRQHGGEVTLSSREGRGTTVTLSLPLRRPRGYIEPQEAPSGS